MADSIEENEREAKEARAQAVRALEEAKRKQDEVYDQEIKEAKGQDNTKNPPFVYL